MKNRAEPAYRPIKAVERNVGISKFGHCSAISNGLDQFT